MKEKVLVSACLVGVKCRYNGTGVYDSAVEAYLVDKDILKVCPELMGGLETPREPCELWKGKVVTKNGVDVSAAFLKGAEKVVELAKEQQIKLAILKSRSPSCGSNKIYDGTFTHTLIDGEGVCAALLKQAGIRVLNEDEIGDITNIK